MRDRINQTNNTVFCVKHKTENTKFTQCTTEYITIWYYMVKNIYYVIAKYFYVKMLQLNTFSPHFMS